MTQMEPQTHPDSTGSCEANMTGFEPQTHSDRMGAEEAMVTGFVKSSSLQETPAFLDGMYRSVFFFMEGDRAIFVGEDGKVYGWRVDMGTRGWLWNGWMLCICKCCQLWRYA